MPEKERTTYPVGPLSYSRMVQALGEAGGFREGDPGRKALREELDLHSAFTYESYMRVGIDAFFDARLFAWLTGIQAPPYGNFLVKASDYWKNDMDPSGAFLNTGTLTCPTRYNGKVIAAIALYSKKCYDYPYAEFHVKMPSDITKVDYWLGFEMGGGVGTGLSGFLLSYRDGVYTLRAAVGGRHDSFVLSPYITAALPADYLTAEHTYAVRVTKSQTEFYIDSSLVAVAINSPNLAFPGIAYPPYTIWGSNTQYASKQKVLVELAGYNTPLAAPLAPVYVRFGPDSPLPPRVYRLYQTGTNNLFAGLNIAAGTLTSHPVPIFGYDGKTIYFKADQNSTANGLVIQVLTQAGNWIVYDTVTYAANDDWYYTIAGEAVLARLVYTPAAYPAVISEGEVVMR